MSPQPTNQLTGTVPHARTHARTRARPHTTIAATITITTAATTTAVLTFPAIQMKREKWNKVVEWTSKVLLEDPTNLKALQRRAKVWPSKRERERARARAMVHVRVWCPKESVWPGERCASVCVCVCA